MIIRSGLTSTLHYLLALSLVVKSAVGLALIGFNISTTLYILTSELLRRINCDQVSVISSLSFE